MVAYSPLGMLRTRFPSGSKKGCLMASYARSLFLDWRARNWEIMSTPIPSSLKWKLGHVNALTADHGMHTACAELCVPGCKREQVSSLIVKHKLQETIK